MRHPLKLYTRYIDNLLCMWQGDELSFLAFVQELNLNKLNLRFTSEYRQETIEFLDIKIMSVNKVIHTTIYRKPCSGNTLLHVSSCHPKNLLGGITVGQFLRLQRNCSTDIAFREQAEDMKERFLDRGYGRKSVNRVNPLGKKGKRKQGVLAEKVPFVRYSRQFYSILDMVKGYLPILYTDDDFQKILISCVNSIPRRSHTLRDLLSPSMYIKKNKGDRIGNMGPLRVEGCYKCGSRRCITCQHIEISKEFRSTVTRESFKIRDYINCKTSTVTCQKCQKQYVGCTNRTLKERICEHLSQIKNPKAKEKSNITRHFAQCNGSDVVYFSVQGIEKIFYLHTRLPFGLNYEFDVTCFT
ncbi:hypothetical protein XELAEV_18026740mg [Xenopus laevis]|uniref:Helix-turn-helix domain-containing protein n=1 Tax=Xenopus laevis TaxID=8355 RepID=A0A974CW48_XENLA|nr:hypothetical protein XELAEV_18026740mg [Xenopus laevis]